MSNLIITIIAIALVAIAALTAAYYGASSWQEGKNKAKALTILNQKEQIKAASALYRTKEGLQPAALDDLTSPNDYIAALSDANAWQMSGDVTYVVIPESDTSAEDICRKAYLLTHEDDSDFVIKPCSAMTSDQVCCVEN